MLPVFQPPGVVHIHYPKCQLTAELDLQHYMNMILFLHQLASFGPLLFYQYLLCFWTMCI